MSLRFNLGLVLNCFLFWCKISAAFTPVSAPREFIFANSSSVQTSFKSVQFSGIQKQVKLSQEFELSNYVIPHHYRIHLFPNFLEGTFTGEVFISITLLKGQDVIRLHVKYLDINETKLRFEGDGSYLKVTGYENKELEYWIIQRQDGSSFRAGDYKLGLRYRGSLTNGIVGFYRSSYTDRRDNTTKFVVSTKFQPTYARRAFPCFDEPRFKSTFSISLVKPSNLMAMSNMPEVVELPDTPEIGLTTVIFKKSVPMVTYLVAVAVGDFACLGSRTKRDLPVRICTTASRIQDGKYASSITAGIVDYYEEYFGIPFPLPKLDLVGIPDYPTGATEHWGMITFRESSLLFKSGISSGYNKQQITLIMSHELAHSWFGNLMTVKEWKDIWLNEGFATRIGYRGAASAQSGWEMESQFMTVSTSALLIDGQSSSHPIVQEANTPDQITELFDPVSYSKGASIIRMLENFMRPSSFRAGISAFLRKYAFANAETRDLWNSLQPYSRNSRNISRIMRTWTEQAGYPVLILERRGSDGGWMIRQERFRTGGNRFRRNGAKQGIDYDSRWEIPVGIQWEAQDTDASKGILWMHPSSETVSLRVDPTTNWIKLNVGQFGYYRVLYPVQMYKTLKTVVLTNFSPVERCGVIDDAFSLSSADYLGYIVALEYSEYLKEENHYIPWSCAVPALTNLGHQVKGIDPETHALFQKYILNLSSKLYRKLSWTDGDNEDHLERLLKQLIFALACRNGHADCRLKSKQLFDRWIQNPENPDNRIPAGFRDIVYNWGIFQSDGQVWNRFLQIYIEELDPGEKVKRLNALTLVQDKIILEQFLQLAKNETIVRRQDFVNFIGFLSNNPAAVQLLWNFYRNEYPFLIDRFSLNDRFFGKLIISVTSSFATRERLQEVQDFFAKYPNGGAGSRARKMALESIRDRISWREGNNSRGIKRWLRKKFGSQITAKDNTYYYVAD